MRYIAGMNKQASNLPTEDDARTDAFIARNRDALNASIRQARHEVAEGKTSTKSMDDIIAEGLKRRGK
ncbi:MAG TPA: hypothetical protein VGG48_17815 [Rhizomicrobium sp.]|jgi:antitoxin ParD1/3/4